MSKRTALRLTLGFGLCLIVSSGMNSGEANAEFTDTAGHWAETAIRWGAERALIDGYDDMTFQPDRTMSEAEFVTLFLRSFGAQQNIDPEVAWSSPYYETAQSYNLPVRGANQIEERDKPISRTKVAELVSGADGKNYTGPDAVRYLLQKGYAQGKINEDYSGKTVYAYRGDENLTRAEALTFVKGLQEKGWTTVKVRPKTPSDPSELTSLPGEKLKGYQTNKGQSGPVLYFTYEVENGNVVFTNNTMGPDDPAYRVRLKEKYNPHINEYVYAIANSLYDPDREKLNLSYSRKGNAAVSITLGTYDMSLQSTGLPYFNKPFEFEVFEELDHSQNNTMKLYISRLWGNQMKTTQFDDYYINKLRNSLISVLGENEGLLVSNSLVDEMKILVQDQAQVQDWDLRWGDPELDYNRSSHLSLSSMDVYIHTSISGIQVNFITKADPNAKQTQYVVTPEGKYLLEDGKPATYKNVSLQAYMSIERKGAVIIRQPDDIEVSKETITTPHGPASMVERQFTFVDDPERKQHTTYEVTLLRPMSGEPDTRIEYTLSGIVIGQKDSAKQDMLDLVQGWVIPELLNNVKEE